MLALFQNRKGLTQRSIAGLFKQNAILTTRPGMTPQRRSMMPAAMFAMMFDFD